MLKIFNTIKRKKEIFKTIEFKKVNIYVCGVTVSNLCHIGHARTFIFFDILLRYLKYCGYTINYIRNITDIDDKIIHNANIHNESVTNFVNKMIRNMHKDFDSLNLLRPNHEPRVSKNIKEIINIINKLIILKYAYILDNGDVIFCINKFKDYGKLSLKNFNKSNLQINKKDFVLWKMSKPGEPSWESPWGKGRPGWHIECSAINMKFLGNICDIHGGGADLIFPHHENEIAQSLSISKQKINYWLHSGLVIINNKKMSKSLNNFFTIRSMLQHYNADIIRYFLMSKHYRKPLIFKKDKIYQSKISINNLYHCLRNTDYIPHLNTEKTKFEYQFKEAMDDDFNIPYIYSIFHNMMHEINKLKEKNIKLANLLATKLRDLSSIIGILQNNPNDFLKCYILKDKNKLKKITKLIDLRNQARKIKDWKTADLIRKKLKNLGFFLEDNFNNTIWKKNKF